MCNFAKNTAHNERRLLNFSYLCNVADKRHKCNTILIAVIGLCLGNNLLFKKLYFPLLFAW